MVPTAPTILNGYPLPSWRRHIGQPLGVGAMSQALGEDIHLM